MYLRLSLIGSIERIPDVLYHYQDHADSLSRIYGCLAENKDALRKDQDTARLNFKKSLDSQKITAGYVIKNEEYFIAESIASIIEYVDEIIIIDTGSTDKTINIIESIQKNHIKGNIVKLFNRSITNYNTSNFRNEITFLSKSDWIMIIDGDEVWDKSEISKFILYLKSIECVTKECIGVYQKRWSSTFEQQTSFVYSKDLIRAYRRHGQVWKQAENVFMFGEGDKWENLF